MIPYWELFQDCDENGLGAEGSNFEIADQKIELNEVLMNEGTTPKIINRVQELKKKPDSSHQIQSL